MSTSTPERAILKTLAYADIFDYPLKKDEIWDWLVGDGKLKVDGREEEFGRALVKLLKTKHCQASGGYYFLPGRKEVARLREQRELNSCLKIKRAKIVARFLKFVPWIRLIGITGGLARRNSKESDDIDLFFITSSKRLWLTRGLVVVFLKSLNLYRRPTKVKNMICPNMFVSEKSLIMEPQDVFTAHEVALMKPIFKRGNTHRKFLEANLWLRRFLPNKIKNIKRLKDEDVKEKKLFNFSSRLLDFLERWAKDFQLWYMRKKRTNEVVSPTLIKFHPQDVRKVILAQYHKRLKK